MRHERIPKEQKLANDALCQSINPTNDGFDTEMGVARNEQASTSSGAPTNETSNDLDWLVSGPHGNMDDPLSNLLDMHQDAHDSSNGDASHFGLDDASLWGSHGGFGNGNHLSSAAFRNSDARRELSAQPVVGDSAGFVTGNGAAMMGQGHADGMQRQQNDGKEISSTSGTSETTQAPTQMMPPHAGGQVNFSHGGGAPGGPGSPHYDQVLTRPFATSALRHAQLQRYRAKRLARHLGHKKIRYECRKTLADNRPRIKGRFAKVHSDPNLAAAALAAVQSCPDLTALNVVGEDKESSEDSNSKKGGRNAKSRLSNGSGSNESSSPKLKNPAHKASSKKPNTRGSGASSPEQWDSTAGVSLRSGGKGMPYTQSEVSLVDLGRRLC
jgi:hypothetical protein